MSDENGKWEEKHKTFRYSKGDYLCDGYLCDLASVWPKAADISV